MPFTFAHPAIVLPLNYGSRRYISLSALIAGSMAPDFEYFLRMKTFGLYGHTPGGWLFFDLPLSLILVFLFHQVIRNPLIAYLPAFLSMRLQRYTTFSWNERFRKHWPVVTLSALAGTGSHLLWDSFTHPSGFFVVRIPALAAMLPLVHFRVYTLLQHGSTVLGFGIIGWALLQLPAKRLPAAQHKTNRYYWWSVAALTAAITALRMAIQWQSYIGDIVATITGAGLWALLIVSFREMRKRPAYTTGR